MCRFKLFVNSFASFPFYLVRLLSPVFSSVFFCVLSPSYTSIVFVQIANHYLPICFARGRLPVPKKPIPFISENSLHFVAEPASEFLLSLMLRGQLRHLIRMSKPNNPSQRLQAITSSLSTSSTTPSSAPPSRELLGHLTLDELRLPVYEPKDQDRLPRPSTLLDYRSPSVAKEIAWLMRKWSLGMSRSLSSAIRAILTHLCYRSRCLPSFVAFPLLPPTRSHFPISSQHSLRARLSTSRYR